MPTLLAVSYTHLTLPTYKRQIRKPMPTLLENKGVFSPVINDSKILPRNSSGIPLPISDMIILQNEYPSISIRFILKITFPFGDVYLSLIHI